MAGFVFRCAKDDGVKFNLGLSTRITFGVLLLLVAGGVLWIDNENKHLHESYLNERSADIESALHVDQMRLHQSIETLRQDVLFLANTPPVSGIVRASMNNGIDPRDRISYPAWEAQLQQIFSAFLRAHPDYYQARFIGAAGEGREMVRVENRDGRIDVVPHEALQAKGDQDYFRAGLILTVGRVHLSEFTLNQEQGKLEEPHRPMLRAVTTVFDASGRVFGMVVINKDVRPLFASSLDGLPPGVQGYIADQRGHYLAHPDAKRVFTFELGGKENIVDDFPSLKPLFESQTMHNDLPFHAVIDGVGGYLAAERVFFDASDPSRFLLLVFHIPAQMVGKQASGIPLPNVANIVVVMILAGAAFMLMLWRTFSPLRRITIAVRQIAAGNRKIRIKEKVGGEIGELTGAFNIMLDKLEDGDLVERENAFRKELIESLPGVFYMIDMQGKFLMWNGNLEQVLQRNSKEIASSHPLEFFEGEGRLNIENAIRLVFEAGKASAEAALIARDGTKIPYHFTGRRVERDGKPVLVGMGLDVSERQHAEEALRVAAATFETHDAILITDAQANIIRVNRAFTEITGYTSGEVLGKNPRIMSSGRQEKAFYISMWQQIREAGSWSGEIWDRRKSGEIYPKWITITAVKNERNQTTQYVGIFGDITERKQAEEEIRNLAFYDALTQLPNRRYFLERFHAALAASARYGDHGALLFIDLDHFKTLNDTLGHDYGDLLLIEVAARIKTCVREIDTVARYGGDEFVALLENISGNIEDAAYKAGTVAEKIREALSFPYQLREQEHASSPSIGISLYHGSDETVDALLKYADAAMYRAKDAGRNNVRFFDPDLQQKWESMVRTTSGEPSDL
jgi:diguanylate cyclase (GGDEF)-like protein/PAS domain S-box-containing protein